MTREARVPRLEIRPRNARPKRNWRRALRALRALIRNPEQTQLAFDVVEAVDPALHERSLSRMLAHPEGRRSFAERPSLLALLSDRRGLEQLPEASFGRAYLAHIDRFGLDPGKLVELGAKRSYVVDADPDVRWMAERSSLCHDLWHVLTGYGADPLGEAALLPFSLAQTGGASNALLTLGANLRVLLELGPRWLGYAWTAWRRGRRAVCLHALPYERLLALPLDEVRRAARIEAPEVAHRGGVLCGGVA